MLPDNATMYRAFVKKDTTFEGVFYTAVKTTKIFCRPTCTARKAKFENVEFFASVELALQNGYRPCKICRPMNTFGTAPEWVTQVLREIHRCPEIRFRDIDLKEIGYDPVRLRRWFKRHYNITFQRYVRNIRINHAYTQIQEATNVTHAALESGYNSLSGFNHAFKTTTGFSPSRSNQHSLIITAYLHTPLGVMLAGTTQHGICLLEFADRKSLDKQLEGVKKRQAAEIINGDHALLDKLGTQLQEYFTGARRRFELPLSMSGTPFQQRVWQQLQSIPYGETRSYQQIASILGQAKAYRAVATANAANPLAILIPCHRVIAKNGGLAGYGGEIWRKQALLSLETTALSNAS